MRTKAKAVESNLCPGKQTYQWAANKTTPSLASLQHPTQQETATNPADRQQAQQSSSASPHKELRLSRLKGVSWTQPYPSTTFSITHMEAFWEKGQMHRHGSSPRYQPSGQTVYSWLTRSTVFFFPWRHSGPKSLLTSRHISNCQWRMHQHLTNSNQWSLETISRDASDVFRLLKLEHLQILRSVYLRGLCCRKESIL